MKGRGTLLALLGALFLRLIDSSSPPLLLSFPFLRNRRKGKLLLQTGDLAFGRVVHQETVRDWSSVHYVFVDGANRGFIGQGTDFSDGLAEGAPTLVFYDPLDPNQNIALECSGFQMKTSDSLEAQARATVPVPNPLGDLSFKDNLRPPHVTAETWAANRIRGWLWIVFKFFFVWFLLGVAAFFPSAIVVALMARGIGDAGPTEAQDKIYLVSDLVAVFLAFLMCVPAYFIARPKRPHK